jgi:hypothetical protein
VTDRPGFFCHVPQTGIFSDIWATDRPGIFSHSFLTLTPDRHHWPVNNKGDTLLSRQIRMMSNEDDDLVLIDILSIFTFKIFYHLLKDIFG